MWKQSQAGNGLKQVNCALGRVCRELFSPERPEIAFIASLPSPIAIPAVKGSVSGFWLGGYDPEREEWMGGWEVGRARLW